jgi:hypothetical protein
MMHPMPGNTIVAAAPLGGGLGRRKFVIQSEAVLIYYNINSLLYSSGASAG